jgi:hypothetical protein
MSVHTRALLVFLSISTWTARKYDKAVSHKVARDYDAPTNAGRYNKFLLPGEHASYQELLTLAGSIRDEHYTRTLPWTDGGQRVLSTDGYMDYADWFRGRKAQFERARDTFIQDYPAMKADARLLLTKVQDGLYKESDYPSELDMAKRFGLSVSYSPLPKADDLRVDLDAQAIAEISASLQAGTAAALNTATQEAWSRLYKVAAKMHERLSQPDAIFRDTLVENAQEVCSALRTLNVTDDPNLEAMRASVERELTRYSPDVLRDNKAVRADVAVKADQIMASMAAFYTPAV